MAGVSATVLALSKTIMERGAREWLAYRAEARERDLSLSDLIRIRFTDQYRRRDFRRQIDSIVDKVESRLTKFCKVEYGAVPQNEQRAVRAAVIDTFAAADLSDSAFFATDADPVRLAKYLRAALPDEPRRAGLGESGRQLYDTLLDECAECYVRLIIQLPAFVPRAQTVQLQRLSELAITVNEGFDKIPVRTMRAPSGTDHDEEFGRRYLTHLSEDLDRLEICGISARQPTTTLSVAYIGLSVSTHRRGTSRSEPTVWVGLDRRDDTSPVDVTDVTMRVESALGNRTRALVRGDAGSGKSTLLRWLAITAARGGFSGPLEDWNGCVPFLIPLRRYADQELPGPSSFTEFTAQPIIGYQPKAWVERQLESGRALLLVDGVDELTDRQRKRTHEWLRGLLTAFTDLRVVVTSRPGGASANWLSAEGFTTAMMQPMGAGDVAEFIRQWHKAVRDADNLPCERDDLPGYEASLRARLDAHPHLRGLATNPLLCGMLCALNVDRATNIPRDRMDLYAAALDMLLDGRDAARGIKPSSDAALDLPAKRVLLQEVAYWLTHNNRVDLTTEDALMLVERRLATMVRVRDPARVVLDHLVQRSGVIREPVAKRIDFIHRTFLEYLAAKEAVDGNNIGMLVEHAHLDRFRETIIMASAHADARQRAELIDGILRRADKEPHHARDLKLLTAASLESVPSPTKEVFDLVAQSVADLIPPRDTREAASLASAGEFAARHLPATLDGLSDSAAAATVRTAALAGGVQALDRLAGYASDARSEVQWELQSAWRYFDPDEYARCVLADAPLDSILVFIDTPEQLSATRHVRHLKSARIGPNVATDLNFLDGLPELAELNIHEGSVTDLTPLTRGPGLRTLRIDSNSEIADLTPLGHLRSLERLALWHSGETTSVEVVGELANLEFLSLYGLSEGCDVRPLRRLGLLRELSLGNILIRDIELFAAMPYLRYLDIFLPELDGGLDRLVTILPYLDGLGLTDAIWLTDLTPLRQLPELLRLLLPGSKVADLGPLRNHTKLKWLELDGSLVEDLRPLMGMRQLTALGLSRCERLASVEPLAALPKLETAWLDGVRPGLDLSPLAGKRITIYLREGQEVRGLETLGRHTTLEWLPASGRHG